MLFLMPLLLVQLLSLLQLETPSSKDILVVFSMILLVELDSTTPLLQLVLDSILQENTTTSSETLGVVAGEMVVTSRLLPLEKVLLVSAEFKHTHTIQQWFEK